MGLSFAPCALFVLDQNGQKFELLLEGLESSAAGSWLDGQLVGLGLKAGSDVELPYEMPADVAAITAFSIGPNENQLLALAGWFENAHQNLTQLAKANAHLKPGPSPVRCWPHHFDIATYVMLEVGDAETAKGIGAGMSPGDEGYAEPYFYINPWPYLEATNLPEPAPFGHWHTEGYVGLVATGSSLLSAKNPTASTKTFLDDGFTIALKAHRF